jgi:hypothetical protein
MLRVIREAVLSEHEADILHYLVLAARW